VFPAKVASGAPAYQFNADYLVSLKPNVRKTFLSPDRGEEGTVEWGTNSAGFRGDELQADPQVRVIVYGDSNVQARFSKTENTFASKLGDYLQQAGIADAEVVNAGVIGFGPDQSLIRFEKEASTYHPDLVIFHIYADNDFGDIVRNRLFDVDPNGDIIKTVHERAVDPELTPRPISNLLIVRAVQRVLRSLRGSEEIPGKDETYDGFKEATEEEYLLYKELQPQKYSHFADHYDTDIALDPDAESSEAKIRLMEAIVKKAKAVATARGIGFLVLIQPSVVDMTEHNYLLNYEYLQKKSPKYRRSNQTDAVKSICIRQGVHFVNLFDVFMRSNPESLFFKNPMDDHWNDRGQDVAARETAAFINNQRLLASRSDREAAP